MTYKSESDLSDLKETLNIYGLYEGGEGSGGVNHVLGLRTWSKIDYQ